MALVSVIDPQELRRVIEAHGTQRDLAERAGLSVQRLSQLVTGTAPNIAVHIAAKIERELQVPLGTLFGIDQENAPLLREYLAERPQSQPDTEPQPEEG